MKKRISYIKAIVLALLCLSCIEEENKNQFKRVRLVTGGMTTRTGSPDEELISDANIFITNSAGAIEEHIYLQGSNMIEARMLDGKEYSIYAIANLGYKVKIKSIKDIEDYCYYFAHAKDYQLGLPMSGKISHTAGPLEEIKIPLTRAMTKARIVVDRSRLDKEILWDIRSIRIVNSPKKTYLFKRNSATDEGDFFKPGFTLNERETEVLNSTGNEGVDLYMTENFQERFAENLCSYIEMKVDYFSKEFYTEPDDPLIYRFAIGNEENGYSVERNCFYRFKITPQGKGLGKPGWDIDTEPLKHYIQNIVLSHEELDFTYKGEEAQLLAKVTPEKADKESIVFLSSDTGIATVDQSGKVTAQNEGECRIICKATDGSETSAECEVSVKHLPSYMKVMPGTKLTSRVGQDIHIYCEFFPPNAKFDIGTEELDYDKNRGIYDYTIDQDGKGVTLHCKKEGAGLLYFETGSPINQAEMIIIVINPSVGQISEAQVVIDISEKLQGL